MNTITMQPPASITATGNGPDAVVAGLKGLARAILEALNTAGTAPTLAIQLQGTKTPPQVGLSQQGAASTTVGLKLASTNVNLSTIYTTGATATSLKSVWYYLGTTGSPSGSATITCAVQSDSTGSPSGTVLATAGTVLVSSIAAGGGWVEFVFATPLDLAASTAYHLVLSASYTASGSNYVTVAVTTVASGGTFETDTSGTWTEVTTQSALVFTQEYPAFTNFTGGPQSGAFTSLSGANQSAVETVDFNGPDLPYAMRASYTIGGSSSPAYTLAIAISGTPAVSG